MSRDMQVTCLPFTEVTAKPLAQMCQILTVPGKKGAGRGATVLGSVWGVSVPMRSGQEVCLRTLLAPVPTLGTSPQRPDLKCESTVGGWSQLSLAWAR